MLKRPAHLMLAIGLFTLGMGTAPAKPSPLPFKADSLQQILKARSGEPFLLILWSLTCPPCHRELELLGNMRREHPKLNPVIVSTDSLEQIEAVKAALKDHGLKGIKSWIFAGPTQRLRYAIDPNWYGVLPRSYFYDKNHQRVTVTGGLEKEQIKAWVDIITP